MTVPRSEDQRTTEIEAQFPAWSVWVSDTGRWWASLRTTLTMNQLTAGCAPFIRADTADELTGDLAQQEALMAGTETP
jgi:hypothetical protein